MAPDAFSLNLNNTVCVMDASGYLGSTLVRRLLHRGYTVRAAVQNQGELQLDGLSVDQKKLKIFHADPFDYLSIIEALKGCSGLFYIFEPQQDQTAYDEFTAEVEVRAAHNVLEACAQTETINKVVFTSSATSIFWKDDRKSSASDFDERHWTDVNFCRKYKLWYALAKTLAEKTAWALAMDRGLNMVSINAGLLVSPDLSINNPYIKGAAQMYEDGVFVTVDINFLVDAHISVYEEISSYGRYLCFDCVVNQPEDAFKLASMLTPSAPSLPQSYEQEMSIIQPKISNKKLNKLMVDFKSRSESESESESESLIEVKTAHVCNKWLCKFGS